MIFRIMEFTIVLYIILTQRLKEMHWHPEKQKKFNILPKINFSFISTGFSVCQNPYHGKNSINTLDNSKMIKYIHGSFNHASIFLPFIMKSTSLGQNMWIYRPHHTKHGLKVYNYKQWALKYNYKQ